MSRPLASYPLLVVLRDRAEAFARSPDDAPLTVREINDLEAREKHALVDLRNLISLHGLRQDVIARACKVDRTMVNKVWNSGKGGRERQWTRSQRVVAATYRALESAGWIPA
jgi:hypothetical protein